MHCISLVRSLLPLPVHMSLISLQATRAMPGSSSFDNSLSAAMRTWVPKRPAAVPAGRAQHIAGTNNPSIFP